MREFVKFWKCLIFYFTCRLSIMWTLECLFWSSIIFLKSLANLQSFKNSPKVNNWHILLYSMQRCFVTAVLNALNHTMDQHTPASPGTQDHTQWLSKQDGKTKEDIYLHFILSLSQQTIRMFSYLIFLIISESDIWFYNYFYLFYLISVF